eukprot:CAMPEP_0201544704 /NCGR_PEP_ID=MMETSP0173_2-20130828/1318_1 /ASSEMBLY_ACC=CAM_ASM_000268 /TAXON_ID=218659 /ORGANISM="Vexillifera sp., Strain DIVA3 564/2" /LENGTH=168 /DNA_ID=CAMNT_0047952921 /DNA_START=248 /DNA_END=754 /DNA_ORIENTATION=-
MNEECRESVAVTPPPYSELKLVSHWICCSLGFWTELPNCIGYRQTGTCLCCTGAEMCALTSPKMLYGSHMNSACCSLQDLQEHGFMDMVWCMGSGACIECCICEGAGEGNCRFPHTCIKQANQCCCIDFRCALPMDEDVPMGCACCGKWFKEPDSMPGDEWKGNASGE